MNRLPDEKLTRGSLLEIQARPILSDAEMAWTFSEFNAELNRLYYGLRGVIEDIDEFAVVRQARTHV